MNRLFTIAAAVVVLPSTAQVAHAGLIFTSRDDFDAAVAGLSFEWGEDFESFAQGPVDVPTIIGSGAAEINRAGTAEIIPAGITLPPFGANEWLGVEGGVGETIQGIGGTSLGVNAIGFDYFSEFGGSYNFHHSGGVDSGVDMPELTPLFVGWVGDQGEVLDFVDYTPGDSAHVLDDFVAYSVPAPSALAVLALGLGCGRRRR